MIANPQQLRKKPIGARIGSGALMVLLLAGVAGAEQGPANPIAKVARLFNPRLVKVEERVQFLERQLVTLAMHNEHPLKSGIGCRGARLKPGDPDPSLTIDLGKAVPIDAVYLVPIQEEGTDRRGLFPKRFTIEFSNTEDFSKKRVLYSSGDQFFPETGGKPVRFAGQETMARFVRLIVDQGHPRGESEVYGLSEFVVISDSYPISFGKHVAAVGDLDIGESSYPAAVTDGRMPLGIWQGGDWVKRTERGDLVSVESADEEIAWEIDLGEVSELDLITLFPYVLRDVMEAGIFPEALEIQISENSSDEFRTVKKWENPARGANHETPLIFDLGGARASRLRIRGTAPRSAGRDFLYGLSEIQIWSGRENIAAGKFVNRELTDRPAELLSLTNGFTSDRQIIPVGAWLNQLHERWRVEREIGALQPMRTQMAAESELNATWGLRDDARPHIPHPGVHRGAAQVDFPEPGGPAAQAYRIRPAR